MRMPNKSILDQLYTSSAHSLFKYSKLDTRVCSSRYSYVLFRDVMFHRHDVIQRTLLRDTSIVDQISFDRPSCYD